MSKIKEDVVRELHTQARKNFLRRKVDIRDKDECWQADLVDMIEHAQPKFNVNDNVRISKYKHIFEKGYKPNWTNEIFTIIKINKTVPVTYKLKDYQENPIQGCFDNEELHRVKHSDIYLIEKS
ncbi:uncharacterized protein LOC122850494 [Aphidius gifuensis]|uniref:uncharacterized protein LOC122850494 n=1 Tax=Aphidius gifuensis TaxID=684658 RepID=UPI001CDC2CAC|nr:uncharacterized protein LOC122850494 [Aphidius gifuensis]